MGNQTDYFNNNAYKPKYQIGDKVFGYYKKIPFIGSVGNDRVINLTDGPEITVHLCLPIRIENQIRSIIVVKHKDVKPLKEFQ